MSAVVVSGFLAAPAQRSSSNTRRWGRSALPPGRFRASTLRMLERRKQFRSLVVSYPELIRDPEQRLPRIAEFIGPGVDRAAMRAAIRPDLHRNRVG